MSAERSAAPSGLSGGIAAGLLAAGVGEMRDHQPKVTLDRRGDLSQASKVVLAKAIKSRRD